MTFRKPAWRFGLAAAAGMSLAGLPVQQAAAADFYAGRTIELEVGADVGGGYDIYARTLARHLGRHIPGNPTIVVKNMPGAGSAKAAQFISMIAPKDGTSIGAIMPGAIMGPLLDDRADALFDPTKVLYVGTANSGTRVCVALKGTKIRTFDDTMTDKAFLADAEKVSIDIDPLPGAKVQDVVAKLYAAPPAIVERARKAIRPD